MEHPILNEAVALSRVFEKTLLQELLREFDDLPELDISQWDSLFARKDYPALERMSHTLKGVAGNLALTAIFKAVKALNDALRHGEDEHSLQTLYNSLKDEIVRFRLFLPTYLNS